MSAASFRVDGKRIYLNVGDPEDHIARCILTEGRFYESGLLANIQERARPEGTAVDVGAHIGNHTIFFAVVCGWDVVALEPWPPSFGRLGRNVQVNGVQDRVVLKQAAAGMFAARAGLVPPPPENTGLTRLTEGDDVDVIPLDDLHIADVNVIKVDTEGRSAAVIAGATETIERCKPLVYAEADTPAEKDAVEAFLFPLGYSLFGKFGATPMWGYSP